MLIQEIRLSKIHIAAERFRKDFSMDVLAKMQDSIGTKPGLLQAICVIPSGEDEYQLVFGETRLKSIQLMHEVGLPVYYDNALVSEGYIPAIVASPDLTKLQLMKMELEENTIRAGFSFIEEQMAISRIFDLEAEILKEERKEIVALEEDTPVEEVVLSSTELKSIEKEATAATVEKAFNIPVTPSATAKVNQSLQIAHAMKTDPILAGKLENVQNSNEAKKVIDRHVREEQHQRLAQTVGASFKSDMHKVIHGDCIEEMKKLLKAPERFDVCLTDPIYGINAGKFGDSAGKMSNFSHDYDDSPENFCKIMPEALKLMTQLMKPAAHIYLACDIRNYFKLVEYLKTASDSNNPWKIPNAPIVQYKIAGGRIPIAGFTFRRSYELWLYAYRGDKQEYRTLNDVIECESDRNENHGASKPIDLLKTLLARSALPGNSVLDFMAGSGGILIAAHQLKVKCTAIEIDETYYGNCIQKLQELK